jgi:hypothetical protein
MARIPAYPYRVIVTRTNGGGLQHIEQHNYANLPGAWAYRDTALRKQNTRKVEIVLVIDEASPGHAD